VADVLTIANDRRVELKAEVAKLDEFIRMCETLLADEPRSRRNESGATPLVLGRGEESGVRVAGGTAQ
jgi:hypothetical protein